MKLLIMQFDMFTVLLKLRLRIKDTLCTMNTTKKSETMLATVHGGLYGCEMLIIPYCLNIPLTDGGKDCQLIYLIRFLSKTVQKKEEEEGLSWR
jgi:hypothetical protein